MNRAINDDSVRPYHYHRYDQLRAHLVDLLASPNFA
jgi:hypothetical protein